MVELCFVLTWDLLSIIQDKEVKKSKSQKIPQALSGLKPCVQVILLFNASFYELT